MPFDTDGKIDTIKYGVLWERVQQMDRKINKIEQQLEELIGLANKGKGGFWVGMTLVSLISGIVGYILNAWRH